MSKDPLYKVVFMNQGEVYEIYARSVGHGTLFGFVEIEELVFGENDDAGRRSVRREDQERIS